MAIQQVHVGAEQTRGESQMVKTNCNEIIFINLGAATAFIDKFPLAAGTAFTIAGNQGEKIINGIQLVQAVSGDVWVWRKIYV